MNRKSMVVKFQGNFVLGASSPVCFKLKSFDSPARAVWRMQVERSNKILNFKFESDLFFISASDADITCVKRDG